MANPTQLQFRELATGRFRDVVTGRFIPNPLGVEALKYTAEMAFMLKKAADIVVAAAKELARREAYLTGDYYRGIRPAVGVDKDGGVPNALARVNAWDYKSGWLEFGSINNQPPHRILQRAAEACGYQVTAGRNIRRITGSKTERVIQLSGH